MRHSLVLSLLLASSLFAAEPTVRVGKETKKTTGIVRDVQSGDVACYLTLTDAQGREFTELAGFEICEMPSLIGKRVTLTYTLGKVMADECQGDPECTKSRTVALVSAVKVQPQTSFCTASENTIFSCATGTKLVSVCESKRGGVQYRFGKPDAPLELKINDSKATGASIAFSGGGGTWLRFHNGAYSYVVYTGVGKWGPRGETREKSGIAVEHNGAPVRYLPCTGNIQSELGPDWLDRVGIESGDEDFEFPD
ncbi:MAG: hypothetical protein ACTHQM_01860 [Thermoanaerobaculia bacterium]